MFKQKFFGLLFLFGLSICSLSSFPINDTKDSSNTLDIEENSSEFINNDLDELNRYDYAPTEHFWGDTGYKSDSYADGSGTEADPYLISSELNWGLFDSNNRDATDDVIYYKVTKDLDLTKDNMSSKPITNAHNIHLDGDNHTISINLSYLDDSYFMYYGIFAQIHDSQIKNITFDVKSIKNYEMTPSAVTNRGMMFGTLAATVYRSDFYNIEVDVDDCVPTNTTIAIDDSNIVGEQFTIFVGNLFGAFNSSQLLTCYFKSGSKSFNINDKLIRTTYYIGGVAGMVKGQVNIVETEIEPLSINLSYTKNNDKHTVYNGLIYGRNGNLDEEEKCVYILDSYFNGNILHFSGSNIVFYNAMIGSEEQLVSGEVVNQVIAFLCGFYNFNEHEADNDITINETIISCNDYRHSDCFAILDNANEVDENEFLDSVLPILKTDYSFIGHELSSYDCIFENFIQVMNFSIALHTNDETVPDIMYRSIFGVEEFRLSCVKEELFVQGERSIVADNIAVEVLFVQKQNEDEYLFYCYDMEYIEEENGEFIHNPVEPDVEGKTLDYWVVPLTGDITDTVFSENHFIASEHEEYENIILGAILKDGEKTPTFVYPDTTYNIIYEANGGTINESEYPLTYKTGDKVVLPTDVTKEGYIFVGWYLDSRLTKKMIQSLSSFAQGTINVYAKYISKDTLNDGEFYVNIEVPGHSEDIITGTYKTGDVINLPVFTQDGYTLIGYRDNPYNEGESVSKVTVEKSNIFHTYYPVWGKAIK